MQIKLHVLKASGRLVSFEQSIQKGFEMGLERVQAALLLPDVDVVVADNPEAAIPETGVGGFAPTAHLLYINIDPTHVDLKIEEEVCSTLAHELHHCARWKAVGYGNTLLEAVVSEGLADHFDIEVNGGEPKPWSRALNAEELEKIAEKAKKEFANADYNHSAWFFGSAQEDIPRWAAYSLGFKIVGDYMEKNQKTAAQLVGERAPLFIV